MTEQEFQQLNEKDKLEYCVSKIKEAVTEGINLEITPKVKKSLEEMGFKSNNDPTFPMLKLKDLKTIDDLNKQ